MPTTYNFDDPNKCYSIPVQKINITINPKYTGHIESMLPKASQVSIILESNKSSSEYTPNTNAQDNNVQLGQDFMKAEIIEKRSAESSLVEDVGVDDFSDKEHENSLIDADSNKENGNSLIDVDWKVSEQNLVQESPNENKREITSDIENSGENLDKTGSNFIEIKSTTQDAADEDMMLCSQNDERDVVSNDENGSKFIEGTQNLIENKANESSQKFIANFDQVSDCEISSESMYD